MRELLNLEIELAKEIVSLKETPLIDQWDRIVSDLEELIQRKKGVK